MAKKSIAKKAKKVDFDDEESVLRAMAKELDVGEEDISIKVSHYGQFGTGDDYYELNIGSKQYFVAKSEDSAEELAKALVKQDLEESPENFEPNFIQSHIDLDRLRRDLMSDVQNMRHEDLADEAKRRPIEFMKEHDLDIPSPADHEMRKYAEDMSDDEKPAKEIYEQLLEGDHEDRWIEMGDEPEVSDSDIEEIADKQAEEQLKDPVSYLEDIYGREDAVKKAIEIGGIDIDAAAEEAVGLDGPGHFLSSYDGNLKDGPDGLVYWRHN